MIRKRAVCVCVAFLLSLFFVQAVTAKDEIEVVLEKNFTMTPIFMDGHEGDPQWIKGFDLAGDIFIDGSKLGSFTGQVTLFDPPADLSMDRYSYALVRAVNSFPGIGSFEVTAHGIRLGSSTSATEGDIMFAWCGSISNGTDGLLNMWGLSAGTANANAITGGGSSKETIRVRFAY